MPQRLFKKLVLVRRSYQFQAAFVQHGSLELASLKRPFTPADRLRMLAIREEV
jgi:hypothetical protein